MPKKYHRYVVPAIRRVYLHTNPDLKKRLSDAQATIKKLEENQVALENKCQRYLVAYGTQAAGEREARQMAADYRRELGQVRNANATAVGKMQKERDDVVVRAEHLEAELQELQRDRHALATTFLAYKRQYTLELK